MTQQVRPRSSPVLRDDSPAGRWTDALPIGNGRLGAMCFGGVSTDRIQLNEDSAWSGSPASAAGDPSLAREDGPEVLGRVRAALRAGDVPGAEREVRALQRGHTQAYQPVADVRITSADPDAGTDVRDYLRWLDLGDAVAHHAWTAGRAHRSQSAFASHPDQVVVVHRRAPDGPPMDLQVSVLGAHPGATTLAVPAGLSVVQRLPSEVAPPHEDVPDPVVHDPAPGASGTVVTALRVVSDGTVSSDGDRVTISGARDVLLLIACATDVDTRSTVPARPHGDVEALRLDTSATLDAAEARGAALLLADHVADHRSLYDRVELELAHDPELGALTTDDRVRRSVDRHDPGLAALAFAYGRYLLIAGSRPGTTPLNLQGIWNEHTRPPWSANYTTNINVEMNYWPVGPVHLAECGEPLLDWLPRLAEQGRWVARDLYGADGWVAHHNTDVWGFAEPAGEGDGDPAWSAWPMGSTWLALHVWDHWAFTGDRDRLARSWPVVRGAVEFALSWLVEDGCGGLTTSPSTSPENTYLLPDGRPASLSAGATADVALLRELLGRALDAATVLGVDDPLLDRVRAAIPRLAPYRVLPDGRLAEWAGDAPDAEPEHRHQSHLIGLFPGTTLDVDAHPELARAAAATLAARGPDSTGWSLAWRLCLQARLRDREAAAAAIEQFLRPADATEDGEDDRAGVYRNLFCAHPPFQIDGNFGFTAGVAELLLQSHAGEIHLLPALPLAWGTGSVRGLRARGGVTVALRWEHGELTAAELVADTAREVTVRWGDRRVVVRLAAGVRCLVGPSRPRPCAARPRPARRPRT
ncbi:glycoside hydrolase family 95 protein [Cellulomonas sp. Marseille-Q8402]